MYPNVHRSTVYNSQDMETTRCPSADEWIRKLWYIYTMEYYSAIKKNSFESVLMRWMKLEPIIQSEVSQKEKHKYSILIHIYIFLAPKSLQMVTAAMKLKDACSLEEKL